MTAVQCNGCAGDMGENSTRNIKYLVFFCTQLHLSLCAVQFEKEKKAGTPFRILYFPLDGTSASSDSRSENSGESIIFPEQAKKVTVTTRRKSSAAIKLDGERQFGVLNGSFPWLIDLDEAKFGFTIMFRFKLSSPQGKRVYILSTDQRKDDPAESMGIDIAVNGATNQLEVRFGFSATNWRCLCGFHSGTPGIWHQIHASGRNHYGLLQAVIAADGISCLTVTDQQDREVAPNYRHSGSRKLYLATGNPRIPSFAAVEIDELVLLNRWMDLFANDIRNGCDPTLDSYTDGEICSASQVTSLHQSDTPVDEQFASHGSLQNVCANKDPCLRYPCSDLCASNSSGFTCSCPALSYLHDIHEDQCITKCMGITCPINSGCIPNGVGFSCYCSGDYIGPACEYNVRRCENAICNHGHCIHQRSGLYKCECEPGYVGLHCDQLAVDCSSNPCQNGGVCVLSKGKPGFHCTCPSRWKGSVCEILHNACLSNYCLNNGRCYLTHGDPQCECPDTHHGARCDVTKKTCIPNPCHNGGNCVIINDATNQYFCSCPPTFTGLTCESDVDECYENKTLCPATSVCVNTFGGYTCKCGKGLLLPHCLTEISICEDSICRNGGTCIALPYISTYHCRCAKPYMGRNCETRSAQRCTLLSSQRHIVAGREITYMVICETMGDHPEIRFNFGDRMAFNATQFRFVANITEYVRSKTTNPVQISDYAEAYTYEYKHIYSAEGEYVLAVDILNNGNLIASFVVPIFVLPNKNTCFPSVSILNAEWEKGNGFEVFQSESFTVESRVRFKSRNCLPHTREHKWTMFDLSVENPVPSKANEVDLPSFADVEQNTLRFGQLSTLKQGNFLLILNITIIPYNSSRTVWNIDKGWFEVVSGQVQAEMIGGARITMTASGLLKRPPKLHNQDKESEVVCWLQIEGNAIKFPNPPVTVPDEDDEESLKCICTVPDCIVLEISKGSLDFSHFTVFLTGKVYAFQAVLRTTGTLANGTLISKIDGVSQEIEIVPEGFPSLEVLCLTAMTASCGSRVNPNEKLARLVVCSGCETGSWDISTSLDSAQQKYRTRRSFSAATEIENLFDWNQFAVSSRNETLLIIKPGVLQPGLTYSVQYTGSAANGSNRVLSFDITVNPPPQKGACDVFPTVGIELDTIFGVECRNFVDDDLPILYRFHYRSGNEKIAQTGNDTYGYKSKALGRILGYTFRPFVEHILERGSVKNSYWGTITVDITDGSGSSVQVELAVKVMPDLKKGTLSKSLEETKLADMTQFLNNSSHLQNGQELVSITGAFAVTLNVMKQLNHEYDQINHFNIVRKRLLDAVSSSPAESFTSLQQIASTFAQVVASAGSMSNAEQVHDDPWQMKVGLETLFFCNYDIDISMQRLDMQGIQEQSSTILSKLSDRLVEYIWSREFAHRVSDSRSVEETIGYFLSATSSLSESKITGNASRELLSMERKKLNACSETARVIMLYYGAMKLPAENPSCFQTESMSFVVGRGYTKEFSDYVKRHSVIRMRMEMDRFYETAISCGRNEAIAELQMVYSENQMVPSVPGQSYRVNTPNLNITIFFGMDIHGPVNYIPLQNVPHPVHLKLPISVVKEIHPTKDHRIWAATLPPQTYTSGNISMYKIEAPVDKDLLIWITIKSSPVQLYILAQEKNKPTLESFNRSTQTIVVNPSQNITELVFAFPFLLAKRSVDVTAYYVGIIAGNLEEYTDPAVIKTVDEYSNEDMVNVTLTLTAVCATCVYWNDKADQWKNDGCKVSNRSTPAELHCDCDHLSLFAGEVFVPKIYADPVEDSLLFLSFFLNPVIIIAVITAWTVYFLTTVILWKLDEAEPDPVSVRVLPDSNPLYSYYYLITISTGIRAQGGTSAKVGILLEGEYDKSMPRVLNEADDLNCFGIGNVDSFLVATPETLGRLEAVTLWHNGEGPKPYWYVDEIVIRDIQTDEIFAFLPNRWLAPHKIDGRLSVVVPVATHEQLTSFSYRFFSFIGRGMRDGHLWVSIWFRPPRSNFTRLQRLTCALSMVLTIMMACLFLYGIPHEPAEQKSHFKYRFDWNQVIIGLESGFLAVPVHIVIAFLFRNASKENQQDSEFWTMPTKRKQIRSRIAHEVLDPAVAHLITQTNPFEANKYQKSNRHQYFVFAQQRLPLWGAHVGWILALGIATGCSYFVSLYGMRFARTKSTEWVISLIIALFQSVAVTQPLIVTLVALFTVILTKSPVERDAEGRAVIVQPTLHQDLLNTSEVTAERIPLTKKWQAAVEQIAILSAKMFQWFMDVGFILTFMASVFIFVHSGFPTGSYRMREVINIRFGELDPFVRVEDMWKFLKNLQGLDKETIHSLSCIYNKPADAASDKEPIIHSTAYFGRRLYPLGPFQTRNLRNRPRFCPVDLTMAGLGTNCFPKYRRSLHDTNDYEYGWSIPESLRDIRTPGVGAGPEDMPDEGAGESTAVDKTLVHPLITTTNMDKDEVSLEPTTEAYTESTDDNQEETSPDPGVGNSPEPDDDYSDAMGGSAAGIDRAKRSIESSLDEVRHDTDYDSWTVETTRTFNKSYLYSKPTTTKTTRFDLAKLSKSLTEHGQDNATLLHGIWTYQNDSKLGMTLHAGKLASYGGGGYIYLIDPGKDMHAVVDVLISSGWVDYLTKALFIRCSIFDVNGKYVSITTNTFEFHESGLVLPHWHIYTAHLLNVESSNATLLAVSGTLFFFFLLFFVMTLLRKMTLQKWTYFYTKWNFLDLSLVIIAAVLFVLVGHATYLKSAALEHFSNDPSLLFSLYDAVVLENAYYTVAAIFLFLCTMKLLKTLRIGRTVNAFLYVLSELVRPFLGFAAMVVVSSMPLIMSGIFFFGYASQQNAGIGAGIFSVLRMMTAEGDDGTKFKLCLNTQQIIGPIYYLMTMICTMFIYTNLLIALIMVVYSTTLKLHQNAIEKDGQLADFVVERMMRMLGLQVQHPVVDIDQFPAAVLFRQYVRTAEVLRKRPRGVRLDKWADLIHIKEYRNMIHATLEDMRSLHFDDRSDDQDERIDFVSHTDEWFLVESVPEAKVKGPKSFPVNKMTPLERGATDTKPLEDVAVLDGLAAYIDESVRIYRKAVEDAKKEFDWFS